MRDHACSFVAPAVGARHHAADVPRALDPIAFLHSVPSECKDAPNDVD